MRNHGFLLKAKMNCFNAGCVRNVDFERIAFYARKRFIEGIDTLTLMAQARDEREKREIALAALLDLDDASIGELKLFNCGQAFCKARSYRKQLQQMLASQDSETVNTNLLQTNLG